MNQGEGATGLSPGLSGDRSSSARSCAARCATSSASTLLALELVFLVGAPLPQAPFPSVASRRPVRPPEISIPYPETGDLHRTADLVYSSGLPGAEVRHLSTCPAAILVAQRCQSPQVVRGPDLLYYGLENLYVLEALPSTSPARPDAPLSALALRLV